MLSKEITRDFVEFEITKKDTELMKHLLKKEKRKERRRLKKKKKKNTYMKDF